MSVRRREFNATAVCSELTPRRKANASIQCPIEKGDYVVKQTVELPKEIPQGEFCAWYCSVESPQEDSTRVPTTGPGSPSRVR